MGRIAHKPDSRHVFMPHAPKTARPIFLKLGESTELYFAGTTKLRGFELPTGTCQTKKITYILARPQNEKVEKAASRK